MVVLGADCKQTICLWAANRSPPSRRKNSRLDVRTETVRPEIGVTSWTPQSENLALLKVMPGVDSPHGPNNCPVMEIDENCFRWARRRGHNGRPPKTQKPEIQVMPQSWYAK